MPELPEVETVRQGLDEHVTGRTIVEVTVHHPRAIRRHEPGSADFSQRLQGATVTGTGRRGKYMWLTLSTDDVVVAHLGMSGQFRIADPNDDIGPHVRVRLRLSDGTELRFVDQRTFGGMAVDEMGDQGVPQSVQHIGLDPFDPAFDPVVAAQAIRLRKTEIKRALLDQTLVSGIGNIYADESLWHARLHFARPTDRLSTKQVVSVLDAATAVMANALRQGGTSFDSLYVNVNGESGYFERSLEVVRPRGPGLFTLRSADTSGRVH